MQQATTPIPPCVQQQQKRQELTSGAVAMSAHTPVTKVLLTPPALIAVPSGTHTPHLQ